MLYSVLALPSSIRAYAGSRQAEATILSIQGSTVHNKLAGQLAGRALVRTLEEIPPNKVDVIVQLEGYFVLEVPLKICGRKNFKVTSPRRTAVLTADSSKVQRGIVACMNEGLLIDGLQFDGFGTDGIFIENSKNTELRKLTVLNTRSYKWSQAAIHLTGNVAGAYVHHNYVRFADYAGILIDTTGDSDVSGVRIGYNDVRDSCRIVDDCGAIYINDRARQSRNIVIEENRVVNFGQSSGGGRGIYLDDWASHALVRSNTIRGSGRFAFQIHGGHDNVIQNNWIDSRQIMTIMLYQPANSSNRSKMVNNTFSDNTILVEKWKRDIVRRIDRSEPGGLSVTGNKICQASACRVSQ